MPAAKGEVELSGAGCTGLAAAAAGGRPVHSPKWNSLFASVPIINVFKNTIKFNSTFDS